MKVDGELIEDDEGNPIVSAMSFSAETTDEQLILSGLYVYWLHGGTMTIDDKSGGVLLKHKTDGAEHATFTPEEDFRQASEEDGEG